MIAALSEQARGDDHAAIKSSIEALGHATDEFAARRMDRSIRAALAGRRIDELASVGRDRRIACPRITVLPHAEICPQGAEFESASGVSVADALLDHHVDIEHACGKVAACTTCHCIVRKGFSSLPPAEDNEEDLLDRAWGLTSVSRLSCQAIVQNEDLTIEIPKYSINHAKEVEQKESS